MGLAFQAADVGFSSIDIIDKQQSGQISIAQSIQEHAANIGITSGMVGTTEFVTGLVKTSYANTVTNQAIKRGGVAMAGEAFAAAGAAYITTLALEVAYVGTWAKNSYNAYVEGSAFLPAIQEGQDTTMDAYLAPLGMTHEDWEANISAASAGFYDLTVALSDKFSK